MQKQIPGPLGRQVKKKCCRQYTKKEKNISIFKKKYIFLDIYIYNIYIMYIYCQTLCEVWFGNEQKHKLK